MRDRRDGCGSSYGTPEGASGLQRDDRWRNAASELSTASPLSRESTPTRVGCQQACPKDGDRPSPWRETLAKVWTCTDTVRCRGHPNSAAMMGDPLPTELLSSPRAATRTTGHHGSGHGFVPPSRTHVSASAPAAPHERLHRLAVTFPTDFDERHMCPGRLLDRCDWQRQLRPRSQVAVPAIPSPLPPHRRA
jgi:hypothetical protein